MAAAGLADVLAGDPDPAVAIRLSDHRLEQAPVRLLDLAASLELGLSLAQPHGERVADPLELGYTEHPGAAHGAHPPLESLAGEGGGEELAEPPLERGDLPPEVVADPPLGGRVDLRAGSGKESIEPVAAWLGDGPLDQFLGHARLPSPGITNARILPGAARS